MQAKNERIIVASAARRQIVGGARHRRADHKEICSGCAQKLSVVAARCGRRTALLCLQTFRILKSTDFNYLVQVKKYCVLYAAR